MFQLLVLCYKITCLALACENSECTENFLLLATLGRDHSPLHNGLGLTPAAAVRLARRHARPINALGDDQPTLSALYYDTT